MPLIVAHLGSTGSGSGPSAFTTAMAQADAIANQIKAASANSDNPLVYDEIAKVYQGVTKFASNADENYQVQAKVADAQGTSAKYHDAQDKGNISNAFSTDMKELENTSTALYTSNPVKWLQAQASGYQGLTAIAGAVHDKLIGDGNVADANSLASTILSNQPKMELWNDISNTISNTPASTVPDLSDFSAVYTTDAHGNVIKQDVTRNGQEPGGYVPVLDARGHSQLINGMPVYVNTTNINGKEGAMLGTTQLNINSATGSKAAHVPGGATFNQASFQVSTPANTVDPGLYYTTADGLVYHSNMQGTIDKIAPDALQFFPDYNKDTAIPIASVNMNTLMGKTGKVITEADMTPNDFQAAGISANNIPAGMGQAKTSPVTRPISTPLSGGSIQTGKNINLSPTNKTPGIQQPSGQAGIQQNAQNTMAGGLVPKQATLPGTPLGNFLKRL